MKEVCVFLCLSKWDGVLPAGKTIQEIAGAIDLLPTLADLAGLNLQPHKPLDGISLKPLLGNKNREQKERYIFSHWNRRISVRSNNFRFDDSGQLFDMINDREQTTDVSEKFPIVAASMLEARKTWEADVLSELPESDDRPFIIGHPGYEYTHIPARDGIPYGNIKRSNQYPNDSFFTNWTSTSDSIVWDAEVPAEGNFEVEIYYTCLPEAVGSDIKLSFSGKSLSAKIIKAHNPPLKGMENDRTERMESYVKEFKPLKVGTIHLPRGKGKLTLKATDINGSSVMDFRLMVFKRI
jgi:hypothetical protein